MGSMYSEVHDHPPHEGDHQSQADLIAPATLRHHDPPPLIRSCSCLYSLNARAVVDSPHSSGDILFPYWRGW